MSAPAAPVLGEATPGAPVVIVVGVLAGTPRLGGLSWVTLNQAAGFAAAGAEVHIVDPVTAARLKHRGPATHALPTQVRPVAVLEQSANAAYFDAVVDRFGLRGRATLLCPDTGATHGKSFAELVDLAARADLVWNTGGTLRTPDLLEAAPVRAYVDLDPGFTQLWAEQGADMGLDGHTHFVTVGPSLGHEDCPIPTLGRAWIGMAPPVSLTHWPVRPPCPDGPFTTVASWRGYGGVWHDGVHYGQKAHALRPLFGLPRRTDETISLALEIHRDEVDDIAALDDNGWDRTDPDAVAGTPDDFASFVTRSKGELGVAKLGYVAGRTGWFSDRSSCYLATGRPVLAQDTGFAKHLPAGAGLLCFDDLDAAAAGMEELAGNYDVHCAAARAIAVDHLDASMVMAGMLDRLGLA